MTIKAIDVGTTSQLLVEKQEGNYCDVLVQNLSANNVYITDSKDAAVASGLKIVTNGTFADDASDENLYIIADGASSDVRVRVNYYPKEMSKR